MKEMFTLVLETSTPRASLATISAGDIQIREFTSDRSHNAVLFGPLRELLAGHGVREIQLVLVGSGPGSYSGTRVGIAAAQGVAIASSCPAVALPSILAVACADDGNSCLAIGDARRGSFWTAPIAGSRLLSDPQLTDAAGLESAVAASLTDGHPVFSFEPSERFPLSPELRSKVLLEIPDARRLWQVWSAATPDIRASWSATLPQPIYLKPPHITPAKRPWLVQP